MGVSYPPPPVVSGALPLIGHITEFQKAREKLLWRGYQEHGDIFTIKLGPQSVAVVSGATHNRTFYAETDKTLNISDGYGFLRPAFGDFLFTAGTEDYYNQRPVLQEIFGREQMRQYIQSMDIEVQRWLDALGDAGTTNLTNDMLQLTQWVAGHAFIGPHFRDELGDTFWQDYEAIGASLDFVLPPHLPFPKFIRRDRAKARLRKTLLPLIQKRRQHSDQYHDLITQLLTVPRKDGSYFSDHDIVLLFVGILFAGHETTAGQAAWTIILLLQHPEYLAHVQQEIEQHAERTAQIDGPTLSRLKSLYWAIDETTRLRPSASLQMRMVEQPLTLDSYTIPTGWKVMVNAEISHHLPDIFTNPEQFDPLRFAPEQNEGKNTFNIVGFGGGIHK
ncbi:MAG: cytochrome P450 [Chloroflexota bacterium]